ncbi:MAG: squalene/phytoene synthase family protein [Deltaproteobacteria bacterium]|nr:squalene/phytoene synthase family protein [Deltaproteobacteria bacterium]
MNLDDLTRRVSRSFALTLSALPAKQRGAVALTYLIARFADTLADAGKLKLEERLQFLAAWKDAFLQLKPELWKPLANVGSFSESEAYLLLEGRNILSEFSKLSLSQIDAGQEVLKTLVAGMEWDLKNFSSAFDQSATPKFGVKDPQTFDWYCYSIAGCVGAYWVKIFKLPISLESLAVAYGKGLQRINIIRDVKSDWNRKRVYLPDSELQKLNLVGAEFWKKAEWKIFLKNYIAETKKLLFYGANFCDSIPYFSFKLRWASAMPLKIGLATLNKIALIQDGGTEAKISRREVKKLAISTLCSVILGRKFSNENLYQDGR